MIVNNTEVLDEDFLVSVSASDLGQWSLTFATDDSSTVFSITSDIDGIETIIDQIQDAMASAMAEEYGE